MQKVCQATQSRDFSVNHVTEGNPLTRCDANWRNLRAGLWW